MNITFAIASFNHEKFIRQAVEAALSQTYQPMQIIVSDDASADDTFNIILDAIAHYRGPHKVVVRKNDKTLGVASQINNIVAQASGEWIVCAGGDDVSLPSRAAALVEFVTARPNLKMAWSGARIIDEADTDIESLTGYSKEIHDDKSIITGPVRPRGATCIFHRDLYARFGPLNTDVVHEDICLPYRAQLLGGVGYLPDQLVRYRRTPTAISNSGRKAQTATDFAALSLANLKIVASYLQMLTDIITFERANPGFISGIRGKTHLKHILNEISRYRSKALVCDRFTDLSISDLFKHPSLFAAKTYAKALLWRATKARK